MSGGDIPAIGSTLVQRLSLSRFQRLNFDAGVFPIRASVGSEQDVAGPRQHLRPAMGKLSGFEFRQRVRNPAIGRDAKQAGARVRGKDDVAVVTPTRAPGVANVADVDWRAALDRDLFELTSWCEKSDPLSIRREEGLYAHGLRTGERARLRLAKKPGGQSTFPVGANQGEYQPRTIR